MSNTQAMHNLGQDIVGSCEKRMMFLQENSSEVAHFLAACREERGDMGRALFKTLAEGERERKQGFITFRDSVRKEQEERNEGVRALLGEFCEDRQGMAREWQKMTVTLHARRSRGSAPRHAETAPAPASSVKPRTASKSKARQR